VYIILYSGRIKFIEYQFFSVRDFMKYDDLVNETESVISFEQILEPITNEERLRITLNKSKNTTDLLIHPHPDAKVTTLQLVFLNYVTYSVIYDDYTVENKEEVYHGQSFRIYQKSNLLESLPNFSRRKLKHYSLNCIEHKVDIISYEEPKITEVSSHNA
jgi:hypothetical protein